MNSNWNTASCHLHQINNARGVEAQWLASTQYIVTEWHSVNDVSVSLTIETMEPDESSTIGEKGAWAKC